MKLLKGMLRVHLAAMESKADCTFPSAHPVITWVLEFVADTIAKYMRGVDGWSVYERLFGKPVREEALEFGERVYCRKRCGEDVNILLDALMHLAPQEHVRAVKRVPFQERWDNGALAALRATQWCLRPSEAEAAPTVDVIPGRARAPPVPHAPEPMYRPRSLNIRVADLERSGCIAGCQRCAAVRDGERGHGIPHRPQCRASLEDSLRSVGDPRAASADRRLSHAVEHTLEERPLPAKGESMAVEAPALAEAD